ncbi:MAG: oligoendopeptidase F [Defluviitaleaceae bacterium]|nr:oligoendopeptidase F [Defluviitaleaceae bacterium]
MEIKQKKRSEIPQEFKWKLENLYPTQEAWRNDVNIIPSKTEAVEAFKGKLTTGESLAACLTQYFAAYETVSRMFVYATMKMHEDAGISDSQGMANVAEATATKFDAATAFIVPEILTHDEAAIQSFITNTQGLAPYKFFLENILREKAHIRSAEVEELLASAQEVGGTARNLYSMLESTDLKFDTITDENGNTVEVTHGRFFTLMQSKDRRVRKDAFKVYYKSFWALKNTLATMLSASIKKDIFNAKARNYNSTLDAALSSSNIPREVYQQLINTVHEFLPAMHRYMALRKKALKVDELHMYDIYTPIVEEADAKISYQDAKKKVAEGLAPLGEEYLAAMIKGMEPESGWIDVYENEGKEAGAYAWGCYGNHPYVLLNHDDTLTDMFTLAHEMGHAMHDHYTWNTQPNVYAYPNIFLAEVASTVNETILMEHMLKTTTDQKTKAYLLGEYLEQFRGTVFRQVMFAEFEMITHAMAEAGEPLTLDAVNKVYRDLNVKYHGPDMVIDEEIDLEWARISHFYRAFYVYQYATGYSAALAFTKRIQNGGEEALEDYLGFLKAGSSDYAIEILKKAGVDMSTPAPVREALQVFEGLVGEMEAILAQQ